MNLDNYVQLHESIEIIYVVDGWEATYLTQDGQREVLTVKGNSVIHAIKRLQDELLARIPIPIPEHKDIENALKVLKQAYDTKGLSDYAQERLIKIITGKNPDRA